ncbi:hypothetical protein DENSPDRAFT_831603 [Dentipellis sp. KUC8613]|nr:hypothetical protein DENSPDRAFT_831603 [Dentipellis sp. KUC8613]
MPPPRWRPTNITRPAPLAPQIQTQRSASTASMQQPETDGWYSNQRAARSGSIYGESRGGSPRAGSPGGAPLPRSGSPRSAGGYAPRPVSPSNGSYAPGSPRNAPYAPGSPRNGPYTPGNGSYAPGSPRNNGSYVPGSPRYGYAPGSPRAGGRSTGNPYEDVQRRAEQRDRPGQRTMLSSGGYEEPAIILESPSIHSTQGRTPLTTLDSQGPGQNSNPDRLSPNFVVEPLPQTQAQPPPQPQFRPPPPQSQHLPPNPIYLYSNGGDNPVTVNPNIPPNYFNSHTTSAMPRPPGVNTGYARKSSGPPSIYIPSAVPSTRHSPTSAGSMRGGTPALPVPTPGSNSHRPSSRTHGRSASSGTGAYAPPSPRQNTPMLYGPRPGSPRAPSPVLPVPAPPVAALQHPQRSHSRSGAGSPYPASPSQRGAALPVPAPSVIHARSRSSGSPDPLYTPSPDMRRNHPLYSGSAADRRSKAGSDASLPPGRPGSPYAHYNPSEEANIAALATASAERLPGT